jgi:ABC-2 type transport system permease protein
MNALLRQTALETKLFLRSRDGLFWTLAFPIFFIVLFGLIYGDTMWEDLDLRAIDFILPGIIVLALLVTGIMATTTGFVEEREKGIYRRLSLTPLKKHNIIGGQIVNRYLVMLVQTFLLVLIGVLAFKVSIVGNYFLFWLALTLGGLCLLTLGFALTGFIRSTKSATPIAMIIFFMLMFLGGVLFPIDIMPKFLEYIAIALPSTHLSDALRMIAIEGQGIGDVWSDLLIVGGWTIGCFAVSIRFFRWE